MKKEFMLTIVISVVAILTAAAYLVIWGGKPEFENFDEVSAIYEEVALQARQHYDSAPRDPDKPVLIVLGETMEDDGVIYEGGTVKLSQEQSREICDKFTYLRVTEDAVFFYEDERGNYGLVYSENPIAALYQARLPQAGREYHRLNRYWYEWGAFAI